jgi:type 1 fimbria pilin
MRACAMKVAEMMNRLMRFAVLLVLSCAATLAHAMAPEDSNNLCYPVGKHTIELSWNSNSPNTVQPGTVLANGSVVVYIRCEGYNSAGENEFMVKNGDWVIQTYIKAEEVYNDNACRTNVKGIGIRLKEYGGNSLECNGLDEYIRVHGSNLKANAATQFTSKMAVEIVATEVNVRPGTYTINWPDIGYQVSWGTSAWTNIDDFIAGLGNADITVPALCGNVNIDQTVNFGSIEPAATLLTQPFQIGFSDCNAHDGLVNSASFKFSGVLDEDGRSLALDDCAECASGAAIEIKAQQSQETLNLGQSYHLVPDTRDATSATYKFDATLVRKEGLKPGKIQAHTTLEVTFE